MQSSSPSGRKARLALLPISWLIAFGVVACVLMIVSVVSGATIQQILRTDTLWILIFLLPALALGKILGFVTINLIAHATPLRRVFEQECKYTGRQDFRSANFTLLRWASVFLLLTVAGVLIFLSFGR